MKWIAFFLMMAVGAMLIVSGTYGMDITAEPHLHISAGVRTNVPPGFANTLTAALYFEPVPEGVDGYRAGMELFLTGQPVSVMMSSGGTAVTLTTNEYGRISYPFASPSAPGLYSILVSYSGVHGTISRTIEYTVADNGVPSDEVADGSSPVAQLFGIAVIGAALLLRNKLPV